MDDRTSWRNKIRKQFKSLYLSTFISYHIITLLGGEKERVQRQKEHGVPGVPQKIIMQTKIVEPDWIR